MNTWKLSVIDCPGYVRIRAVTEARAREIAHDMFTHKNVDKIMHAVNWSEVAWTDKDQVNCQREEDDLENTEGILDIV